MTVQNSKCSLPVQYSVSETLMNVLQTAQRLENVTENKQCHRIRKMETKHNHGDKINCVQKESVMFIKSEMDIY